MEIPYCQVWLILTVLKIPDNMGFKPEGYMRGYDAGRSINTKKDILRLFHSAIRQFTLRTRHQ